MDTTFAGNLGAGNTKTTKLTKTDVYDCAQLSINSQLLTSYISTHL